MAIGANVSVRFDDKEKAALIELANRFRRSQSDILRVLVCEALAVLKEQDMQITPEETTRPRVIARRITNQNHT